MQWVLKGRRVLRGVLRRGSKKGLSRRHLEGRSTPFREYDPLGVCPSYESNLSVQPKCSHRCVSWKEPPLKPVQILKHTTRKSTEQMSMRTKWFELRMSEKGGLSLRGVAFMTVLAVWTVLAVLESTLPSFCFSYRMQYKEAAVTVLTVWRFRRLWRFRS